MSNPTVKIEPVPAADKITSPNDLLEHINKHNRIEGLQQGQVVIIAEGSLPNAEQRDKIIFTRDNDGGLHGPFRWKATGGADCCETGVLCCMNCGDVGELKTFVRTADTMAEEKEKDRFACGWKLANGTDNTIGGDLTGVAGLFQGSAPDWDVYTVVFEG